jgi:hypothetical protein
MDSAYRVSKSPEVGDVVDSSPAVEAFARENGPGRYYVDENAAVSLPGSMSSVGAWGNVIHHKDSRVVLEPRPWDER